MKHYVAKYHLLRAFCALIPSAEKRSSWLKKHKIFAEMGECVHFQPRVFPADPKFVKLHNNVAIASKVSFITHDIIHKVFNNIPEKDTEFKSHLGCIEIMDNVFVGSNTVIMPNIRIGPNAIVAAGSVVTKDVKEGTIVGGNPAKVIGSFEELMRKRAQESKQIHITNRMMRIKPEWEAFYRARQED